MDEDKIIATFKRFIAALERNDRAGANKAARSLIEARAPLAGRWKAIATVMQTNGELNAANAAMELMVNGLNGSPTARIEQAAMLAQTGRLQAAWDAMDGIPPSLPDPAGHAFIKGTMAVNLGDIEDAQRWLLAALDANPHSGQAALSLAATGRMRAGNPHGDRILAAGAAARDAEPLERAHFHFACGRVHFDRDEADAAFADFRAGAELVKGWRPHDRAQDEESARISREGFTRDNIAELGSRVGIDTSRAIFVTGLPRSGTTLVEQILVSHSTVTGGEELGRFSILERDLGQPDVDTIARYVGVHGGDTLPQLYLHLVAERFGPEGRVVDKSLNTSHYIGLVASILPQAPIVWLRRNPLDCAWSAYRTYFAKGLDWSWDLEDIAHHFRLEDELFAHWTELLGDRILVLQYEDLVRDPEPHIRRLLAHCGLDEEPGVFEPHKTRRTVTTASVMQVRQPINTGAIDAAGPYRAHLQPFIDAYEGG